jgi:RNA polymerase sigma factor (sigma-70 family)
MWPDDFPDWYEWAYPQVYRVVYRYLRRRGLLHDRAADLAEESTQEAARRAAERTGSPEYFDSGQGLRNWMSTVARNYASDQLDLEHAGQFPEGHDEPHRPSSREEFFAGVWECLVRLPPQDQRILDWYYWDRLTDVEIGQALFNPSEGTPPALGQRARRLRLEAQARLRECLLQRGIDPLEWNLGVP